MAKKKETRISFRTPLALRTIVREFIAFDSYMNESEFYRDAVREKIKSDAPDLYKKLFEKEVPQ